MQSSTPTLMEMLRGLIATPSISSVNPNFDQSNRPLIELLANWLDTIGFQVEILPLPGQPDKANLIASLGQGPGGLVLSGHTDTVPFDAGRWSQDPFTLTEKNHRLYGLGTADMKSFLALAIEAARPFVKEPFKQPLIILATADEETSMDGAHALVDLGRPRARFAVVGEPTGLRPVRAHKGMMMEAIRVIGQAGHSSDPALGNSALEGMHMVLSEILHWRNELQTRYRNPLFAPPVPTLNLGHIHGGDNPNRICSECELHIDLRPLPGMDPQELRSALTQRLQQRLQGSHLKLDVRSLIKGTAPMETPADSALVQATEQLTGHPAQSAAYSTEGPYLRALGMDTVILGPGHIAQAHQPDEYIALDTLAPSIGLLRKLIQQFCLQPE